MTETLARLREALSNRYAIEREIGHGGMATVYLARDLRHNRQVALKVLRPELATAIGSERFLREIRTTAQLTHPHILAMHDSGDAAGLLYYIMPYIEGESLRERLRRDRQLSVEAATRAIWHDAGIRFDPEVVSAFLKRRDGIVSILQKMRGGTPSAQSAEAA